MNKYATKSKILTALAIPSGIFAATLLELILKHTNPSHIDITADLAYLRQTVITGIAVASILMLCSLALIVIGHRKRADIQASKQALLLLVIVILLSLGSALMQNRIDAKERAYTNQKFENFFQQLNTNKLNNKN